MRRERQRGIRARNIIGGFVQHAGRGAHAPPSAYDAGATGMETIMIEENEGTWTIRCRRCLVPFEFTAEQRAWFRARNLATPKPCGACRGVDAERRSALAAERHE